MTPDTLSERKLPAPRTAYIGIGGNLGDVHAALQDAFAALSALRDTRLVARSSTYRTAPINGPGPDYLNAVAELATGLAPHALLAQLHAIEQQHGRERGLRNAPRTLDLDLLLYGDEHIDTPTLSVPHPRLHLRAFVLVPLAELAPGLVVPGRGAVAQLLHGVADQLIDKLSA